ncbi:hypothetical protein ERO13_A01G087450v2 [Gossypium hirsutum]|nr:hypothetical protein ERO13_A01G087450v2 [Gossypium hirsutum]TYH30455.1 hypothetical protein ES288_A01G096600v1 [Gossypium darwinii]TYI42510.1 hypothetical protein ES332_A01G103600v1 [Gossypium tomentosum]
MSNCKVVRRDVRYISKWGENHLKPNCSLASQDHNMANTPFCMLLSNIWFHMFEKQGQFGKERKGKEGNPFIFPTKCIKSLFLLFCLIRAI